VKQYSKFVALVSVVLATLAVGFSGMVYWRANATNGAPIPGSGPPQAIQKVPVRTVLVESSDFTRRQVFNGSVRAREFVEITSEVSGRVASIHFEDGDEVEAGARLLSIDDREQRAQAQAVEEELGLAELNLERLQLLWQSEGISQRDLDEARSRRNVLAAQLENLKARLEKYQIVAPFTGKLGFREVSFGASLQPGMRITTLQSVDPILIDFAVSERFRSDFFPGLPVLAQISGHEDRFVGEVFMVDPRIDPSTRTVTVRAQFANPSGFLQSGGFARIQVDLSTPGVMIVPATAVVRGLLDVAVWVVIDGRAERRVVELGERTEDAVEILGGIEVGDELIIEGTQRARPGVAVEILPAQVQIPSQVSR
jgi:membrane fusion protein, multidrug efflux system